MYQRVRTIRNACVVAVALVTVAAGYARAAGSDPEKCRRAVALESAKFERDRIKRLKKCEDFAQNGKDTVTVDACFTDATAKIDAAAGKLKSQVAKACCGKNKICNPTDTGDDADLTIAEMEWDNRVKTCGTGNRAGLVCQANADCVGTCVGGAPPAGPNSDCATSAQCGGGTCTGGFDCALPVAGPSYCPTLENGKTPGYTAPAGGAVLSAVDCGTCLFGSADGQDCRSNADCGTACEGGANDGLACAVAADCPGGSCRSGTCNPGLKLDSASDVANCLLCNGAAAVDQVVGLGYDSLNPFKATNPAGKPTAAKLKVCKRTVGNELRKFFDKKRNFLRLCEDKVIHGLLPGPCPDVDTATKITTAEGKLISAISDATKGKCKDFDVSDIGAPVTCPAVGTCGGPIDTVVQLANCLACVAEFKVDCNDALAATFTSGTNELASACNALCGNGTINAGETCDDGNVSDGDACPSDCTIAPCSNSGSTVTATVSFTPPASTATLDLSAMTVYLQYPESKVRIPGQGSAISVQDSINVPSGATFTPNDLDYALNILLNQPDLSAITSPAFEVTFQTCTGAPAPVDGDFRCLLRDGADTSGNAVYGGTCTVDVP